jgi:para-aminobenzoate synthetase component 1
MLYSREQVIDLMNKWGSENIPFLFIVDFEMKRIQLFRIDQPLPLEIKFSFPNFNERKPPKLAVQNFSFEKYPIAFSKYKEAFDKAIHEIYVGNSFLLNLTFPTKIDTNLTFTDFFDHANSKYKLLVNNEFVVFSPETFTQINEGIISSNPMKGTINANVENAKEKILANEKETAEHNTIVDLIRNDLSKVASGVHVKRFRYIDEIKTNQGSLLQVSSEIEGKLPNNFHENIGDILFTLLPVGSVTGAPKEKTVNIIKSVESGERRYTQEFLAISKIKALIVLL